MQSRIAFLCAIFLLTVLAGCSSGSGSSSTPSSTSTSTPAADFTLAIAPLTVTLTSGGSAQAIDITTSPVNGFTGNVSLTVGSLPAGVTVTPMTLSNGSWFVAAAYGDCRPKRGRWEHQHHSPGLLWLAYA
jgi:hypothetical protein